jgi:hypothetical protein
MKCGRFGIIYLLLRHRAALTDNNTSHKPVIFRDHTGPRPRAFCPIAVSRRAVALPGSSDIAFASVQNSHLDGNWALVAQRAYTVPVS